MDKALFRLSDSEKAFCIEQAANPRFNEENGWKQDRVLLDVYDDYAICANLENGGYERVYYTKEGDVVTLGEIVPVYIVDVTSDERLALEAIKATAGTYAAAQEKLEQPQEVINSELVTEEAAEETVEPAAEMTAETEAEATEQETQVDFEKEELVKKVEDTEAQITAMTEEKATFEKQLEEKAKMIADFEAKIAELESEKVKVEERLLDITSENKQLVEFKQSIEKEKKEAILTKYEEYLNEAAYATLKDSMDKYSIDEFKKEVCTVAVESCPSIFDKKEKETLIYTGTPANEEQKTPVKGAVRVLNKYKDNGGNK